jgi:hypothetical protein
LLTLTPIDHRDTFLGRALGCVLGRALGFGLASTALG